MSGISKPVPGIQAKYMYPNIHLITKLLTELADRIIELVVESSHTSTSASGVTTSASASRTPFWLYIVPHPVTLLPHILLSSPCPHPSPFPATVPILVPSLSPSFQPTPSPIPVPIPIPSQSPFCLHSNRLAALFFLPYSLDHPHTSAHVTPYGILSILLPILPTLLTSLLPILIPPPSLPSAAVRYTVHTRVTWRSRAAQWEDDRELQLVTMWPPGGRHPAVPSSVGRHRRESDGRRRPTINIAVQRRVRQLPEAATALPAAAGALQAAAGAVTSSSSWVKLGQLFMAAPGSRDSLAAKESWGSSPGSCGKRRQLSAAKEQWQL